MTIKVISKGKPAKEVVKRATCKNCGARMEYVPADVKRYDGTDISGGPDGCEWIDCPECKARITLRSW